MQREWESDRVLSFRKENKRHSRDWRCSMSSHIGGGITHSDEIERKVPQSYRLYPTQTPSNG